jgi:O-antigen/teichoic acid export membrane protein
MKIVGRVTGRTTFGRSVLVLAGGTIGAQVITVAVSPLLTRLYSPTELGQLGLCIAFVSTVTASLTLRYDAAIVSQTNDAAAGRLAVAATAIVPVASAAVSVLLLALIVLSIAGYGEVPLFAVPAVAVTLLLAGWSSVLRFWLVRRQAFGPLNGLTVLQSAGRAVAQVAGSLVGLGLGGLLIADIVGRAASLVRDGPGAARQMWNVARPVTRPAMRRLLSINRDFPVYAMPSTLLNSLAVALPLPLVAALYGVESAGYFALVQRVLALPVAVIGAAVSDAFFSRLSGYARDAPGRGRPLLLRTAAALGILGIPFAVVVVLFAPRLFALLFGADWEVAGDLAVVMVPWMMAQLIVSPVSRAVFVYGGQRQKLSFDVLAVAGAVVSLWLSARLALDLVSAVALLSVVQTICYGLYFALLLRLVPDSNTVRQSSGPDPEDPGPVPD